METGKMINRISNRLRRRSRKVQRPWVLPEQKGMCWIIFWWKVKNTTCIRKRLKRNLTFVLLQRHSEIARSGGGRTDCPCTGRRGRTAEKNCLYGKSKGDPKCPPVGNQAVGRSSAAWHFQRRAGCIYEDYG